MSKELEARAAAATEVLIKETSDMPKSSPVGELSSGFDATTPEIDKDQYEVGLGHEQAVNRDPKTDGGAHFTGDVDKRDDVGRAASLAKKLLKTGDSEGGMPKSSPVGELSSGFDAITPDIDKDQYENFGLGHEQATNRDPRTDGGAHFTGSVDKRDEVGRAAAAQAAKKRLAIQASKAFDLIADTVEQFDKTAEEVSGFDTVLDGPNALNDLKSDAEILAAANKKSESFEKFAAETSLPKVFARLLEIYHEASLGEKELIKENLSEFHSDQHITIEASAEKEKEDDYFDIQAGHPAVHTRTQEKEKEYVTDANDRDWRWYEKARGPGAFSQDKGGPDRRDEGTGHAIKSEDAPAPGEPGK